MILSIDPGIHGAFALYDPFDDWIRVWDMPVVGKLANVLDLLDTLKGFPCDGLVIVIETQQAMPKQGVTSSFTTGQNFGRLEGALLAFAAEVKGSYHPVRPNAWKRALRLSRDKEASRQMALNLWPSLVSDLRLKKHSDRAEALLLGHWWHTSGGQG